ncbi:MAG: hypothetical protein HOP12_00980 [Candidatus Eisenbacteria bacterium]|uniref:PLAT domain-containing protein n=1 Tax=Eiseniibacteriota bacterium TaxID=2212470 RepID=A0A849SE10_UNCEI|nr:hypothetical protein [Candidatus Eisenbacteria bacterium]
MSHTRHIWTPAIVLVAALCVHTGSARAFDTALHFDMTEDILRAEGFSPRAIKTIQSANFMVDFYEFIGNKAITKALDTDCRNNAAALLKAADDQHFDELDSTANVARKWDALLYNTKHHVQNPTGKGDLLRRLALLGMSLHNVQDFYTHSNWAELGADNPLGSGKLAAYGTHPTWLSVDRSVREKLHVYTTWPGGGGFPKRTHGDWNSDATYLNKDWEGRPRHTAGYLCAYFATRQWVRLFRTFVTDAEWTAMKAGDPKFNPDHDWDHARRISFYGGHWNGNGGPTGLDAFKSSTAGTSPDLLLESVLSYIGVKRCVTANATELREEARRLLLSWGTMDYHGPVDPVLPSAAPENVDFVQVRVHRIDAIDTGDGPAGGQLDWYSRAVIGGQHFWSGLIDEHDNFDFGRSPYAPWTMTKSLPTAPQEELLVSLIVQLRTGTISDAGTDDDVFLRLSNTLRLEFPYHPGNDFENGANDTYSFTVKPGTRMRDITSLAIEKNGTDGWQLGGVTVTANGRTIYSNNAVNTWLDTDTRLVWSAADFKPLAPAATLDVPILFELMELDYSEDDKADVNPVPGARGLGMVFSPASGKLLGDVSGASPFSSEGRGDSDRARVNMSVVRVSASCRK